MAEPSIEIVPFSGGEPGCHVRVWRQQGKPRGSVVVLHGIQSHGGWYLESCARLADAGYEVRMPDRRGSGLTSENHGDAPSLRVLLDDIAEIVRPCPPPRFLAGISWGGKLAMAFDRRHPGLLAGVTLIAPGLCEVVGYSLLTQLRILASRFLHPTRRFPLPLTQADLFTANPERQRFIDADPLMLREATARLLVESRRLDLPPPCRPSLAPADPATLGRARSNNRQRPHSRANAIAGARPRRNPRIRRRASHVGIRTWRSAVR